MVMNSSAEQASLSASQTQPPLHIHVERAVRQYFAQLQGEEADDLYTLVLHEVEKPLLSVVLEQTRGNQTRAAKVLGLNRGTLRKKLKTHKLM